MKYFLDTEFIEYPNRMELISIGIKAEDGRDYYAVHTECDCSKANDWVKTNVLMKMPEYSGTSYNDLRGGNGPDRKIKTILDIKKELLFFLGTKNNVPAVCEFYGYYSNYDWVIFCWIFGHMSDLPASFPMFCMDLRQMMKERGLTDEWKDKHVPQHDEHNAREDANWNFELYKAIMAENKTIQ